MAKIIRPAYPLEFSIGLLLLIFLLSAFISFEIFTVSWRVIMTGEGPLLGMILSGMTEVSMSLILWEDFLFPIRIKPVEEEIVFRNHFTKLKTQVSIYCAIPAIIVFIYLNYEVSSVPFFIWAAVCLVAPVAGKLISGLRNYNDYLKLTNDEIVYRDNEKERVVPVSEIRSIVLMRDDEMLSKLKVHMLNDTEVIIDLDQMELEAYLQTIEGFVRAHYNDLVKSNPSGDVQAP